MMDYGLDLHPVCLRLIRIELSSGEVEVLITSLIATSTPIAFFKKLHHDRWPVEEDYKVMKCRIELENFSGQTKLSVYQDVHSRVFSKNITSMLAFAAKDRVKEATVNRESLYKINFTQALSTMRDTIVVKFQRATSEVSSIPSVRFLDKLERKGRGWNLTLQVLDGILCHDGEVHSRRLSPQPISDFNEFDRRLAAKEKDPKAIQIGLSKEVSDLLLELKKFNYERIYLAPETKRNIPLIRDCYQTLFAFYLDCLKNNPEKLPPGVDLMADLDFICRDHLKHERRICDFIAGMTDDYFIAQARQIGCTVPGSL